MDYNALLIVLIAEKQQEVLNLRDEIERIKQETRMSAQDGPN